MIDRIHLHGTIYAHEVFDPNAEKPLIIGWRLFHTSGEDEDKPAPGMQVPVQSRYAAEEIAKAMQHALDEGKREGYRRGIADTEARVRYVADLLLSPIAKAIDTLNKES